MKPVEPNEGGVTSSQPTPVGDDRPSRSWIVVAVVLLIICTIAYLANR